MLRIEKKSAAATAPKPPAPDYGTKRAHAGLSAKAVNAKDRTFEGMLSTWDLDLGGDVIHRGAFKRTLTDWRSSGRIIPLIDNHEYRSVTDVVGKLLEAKETSDGLWTKWQVVDGPTGDEILSRLEGGFIDGLSIGYRAVKIEIPSDEEVRSGVYRHLHEVELREGSVVIWPMNEASRIDPGTVKSLLAGELTPEQEQEIRALPEDQKSKLRALLSESEPPEVGTPAGGGPAPDDSALDDELWDITLRSLVRAPAA